MELNLNVYCECCGTSGKVTLCEKRDNVFDTFVSEEYLCDECIEIESNEYSISEIPTQYGLGLHYNDEDGFTL